MRDIIIASVAYAFWPAMALLILLVYQTTKEMVREWRREAARRREDEQAARLADLIDAHTDRWVA